MTTTPPPLPPPRGRWKRRILSLCLFLAGVVCGIGLISILIVEQPDQARRR